MVRAVSYGLAGLLLILFLWGGAVCACSPKWLSGMQLMRQDLIAVADSQVQRHARLGAFTEDAAALGLDALTAGSIRMTAGDSLLDARATSGLSTGDCTLRLELARDSMRIRCVGLGPIGGGSLPFRMRRLLGSYRADREWVVPRPVAAAR